METGLTISGFQDLRTLGLNLAVFSLTVAALSLFSWSKAYRHRLRKAIARGRLEETTREYAADLGLIAERSLLPDPLEGEQGDPAPGNRPAAEMISSSFDLQMDMIRQALQANTVALLWPDSEGKELRLRNIASDRTDIVAGPYPPGTGITGALRQTGGEIALAPAGRSCPGLPYYHDSGKVGGVLAMEITTGRTLAAGAEHPPGILCVDREATAPWTAGERAFLRMAANKLSLELNMGRRLLGMDMDRSTMQQLYLGLRELNGVLGLEACFDATIKTITTLVHADFVAISLIEGKVHRIARAEGPQAEHLDGLTFPVEEGLLGQALKFNRSMPAKAEYDGPAPVFSNSHRLKGFHSLLIVPLRKEEGGTIGALCVAAQKRAVFTRARQDILELIAGQIAVKIDLAQAHEKINRLATTDGLTELANHRTFQHAFDIMLARAERRGSLLCIILCDIDHFKGINDSYGHPFGDTVLHAVAQTLGRAVRKIDLAARYGGEEFAIILEDAGQEGGWQMAERIRGEVEKLALACHDETMRVTISLGLAAYPKDGDKKDVLIGHADQALYRAKRAGRNRVVAWSGDEAPPAAGPAINIAIADPVTSTKSAASQARKSL
jgi:diguanylate cyclase (GGDEF)-like protein